MSVSRALITMCVMHHFLAMEAQTVDTTALFSYEPFLTVAEVNKEQAERGFKNVISTAGLNVIFARQLAQYLSSSTDLSYNKGYAVLDDEDDRLYLGYTYNYTKDFGTYIRNLSSVGVKSNIADGFSTLWSEGVAQPDIGLSLKHSFIFGGTLSTGTEEKNAAFSRRRERYIEYLKAEAREDMRNWADVQDTLISTLALRDAQRIKEIQDILDTRAADMSEEKAEELVNAEVDYVLDEKLFTVATNSWLTVEVYLPFTESEYLTADSITMTTATTKLLRPFEGRLSYSRYWQFASGQAVFIQAGGLGQQFNTVLDKSVEAVSFEQWRSRGGTDTLLFAQLDAEDVYVGAYDDYVAMAVTARGALLFPMCGTANRMGFSASIEKYFGEAYDPLNWKLGIPFSLMDKDGEPAVNFEIQWREQNKEHSIGLSVGLPIGKFVYE